MGMPLLAPLFCQKKVKVYKISSTFLNTTLMARNTKSNPKRGGCTSLTPLVVLAAVVSALVTGGAVVGITLHAFAAQQTELQEPTEKLGSPDDLFLASPQM